MPLSVVTQIFLLERKSEDIEIAIERVAKYRRELARKRDERHPGRQRPTDQAFTVGDLVLLFDSVQHIDMSTRTKLSYRWRGPYRVVEHHREGKWVRLAEPDGAVKANRHPTHRVKKFWTESEDLQTRFGGRLIPRTRTGKSFLIRRSHQRTRIRKKTPTKAKKG
jgi:hypothetical protein